MANNKRAPHTAGRVIREPELRGYLKCSELYNFGGTLEAPTKLKIIQRTVEKIITQSLRKDAFDTSFILSNTILESAKKYGAFEKLMEPQVQALVRECTMGVTEVFKLLPLKKYNPVMGPLPLKLKLSKTLLEFKVSGVLRTRNRLTLHVIDFVPYSSKHAMKWDMSTQLKLNQLRGLLPKRYNRKVNAVMHLFGMSEKSKKLTYTNLEDPVIDKDKLQRMRRLVENMERGYHMPLIPCNYSCKFKDKCYP